MAEPDTITIHVKMERSIWEPFTEKADGLHLKSSELLRKVIRAFNEDRVTITPTKEEQQLFKID